MSMKDDIKRVATEMLTKDGFHSVSYADIAKALDTTTTNIHYHFGNKLSLVREILNERAERVVKTYRTVWTDESMVLDKKIRAVLRFNREIYDLFNPPGAAGQPWGLLIRLAPDSAAFTDDMRERMKDVRLQIAAAVQEGIAIAIRRGELLADAPQADIARLFTALHLYGPLITRDAGNFEGLERALLAQLDLVLRSYGTRKYAECTTPVGRLTSPQSADPVENATEPSRIAGRPTDLVKHVAKSRRPKGRQS